MRRATDPLDPRADDGRTVGRSDAAVRSPYVMAVDLEGLGGVENRQHSYRTDLLEGIPAVPGIQSASLEDIVPLSGFNMIIGMEIAGESPGSVGQDVHGQ